MLGDKAYDADTILAGIAAMGVEAVIPPRSNRLEVHAYDEELYKERHLIECFISKLKHFRRIFSRFESLPATTSRLSTSLQLSSGYADMSTEPSLL